MKRIIAVVVSLVLICAALNAALAEGEIKRIGTLQMLNLSEQDYAAVQKLRAIAGEMLNEENIPAQYPYYDGMLDDEPEIVFFDSLNDMIMALDSNQIDAIDLNRSTADYLCARNEGLKILMDYSDSEDNILTDFVFATLLSFDFSPMLPEANQALADELSEVLVAMEEDGTLDELAKTYIDDVGEEVPDVELPVIEGAETLRVAVTGDLPPMDYVTPDGRPSGFNVAVLAALGERIGQNIELVSINASARAMVLASNQVDAVLWSCSCMAAQEVLEDGVYWKDMFEPEDEEDVAMIEKIERRLCPFSITKTTTRRTFPRGWWSPSATTATTSCWWQRSKKTAAFRFARVLRYRRPGRSGAAFPEGRKMQELSVLAVTKNLPQVLGFVDRNPEALGCGASEQMQIDVSVEEIFVNIASYAYTPNEGPVAIQFEATRDPVSMSIRFLDHGIPYDPLDAPEPDISSPLRERKRGGLGIFISRQYMDAIDYQYKDGQNILTLKKRLSPV